MLDAALPEAFVRRMTEQLGSEATAYFAAMEQPPVRGLRLNPLKPTDAPLTDWTEDIGEPVPWEANGRYLSLESTAGAHPLHEAGAFYLQEPSAMLPASVLAAQPGETVLDLCAAPGGKSTQLAAAMKGRGLLVCNEPVPSRAQILSRNLERLGVTNALVVSDDPSRLAPLWGGLFDRVLVDAPCSGEGMFRRHPEARLEWSADAPARCAERQKRILQSALVMLKPGGTLAYSTCTLNREENEQVIEWLLQTYPDMREVDFTAPGTALRSENGTLRLYPHSVRGEGHFMALLRKMDGDHDGVSLLPPDQALAKADKPACAAFADFWQALTDAPPPAVTACLGETLLSAPPLPQLRGVKVLRAGLSLGQAKGKRFAPDHALAMSAPPLPHLPLDERQARLYQRGEALDVSDGLLGYCLPTLGGLPLGFGKASGGQLKNHYPKGLRRP